MRILVTGGNGFLASRIIRYYRERHDMTGVTHSQMDFTDKDAVKRTFERIKPQAVFHCGAVSDTKKCGDNPESSYLVNVTGSGLVAAACREYGAKLVFCSSDQVYVGSEETSPHREEESLFPPHAYGRQKLEAEQICMEQNPDTVALRLSWMYDRDTDLNVEHGNLMANVKRSLKLGETLRYPVYDYRSITNVWEVVENFEPALHLPAGVYNFGSENDLSTYQVVELILKLMGVNGADLTADRESFAEKNRNLRMNIAKIRSFGLGFLTTSEGIKRCMSCDL
ncbi:hypothetical protein C0033_25620 [Clostridium sp. chh4-2]|uniref:SDR family oxidoreductase n=1 Tax=Clostridium sp. chh4-2 TaxID=2067550 RepID=UPI000CCF176A|nr:sugar nucleotide-binding protein [Clostridium sp. chh4-2]PNV59187.1 hypothetical protein C0033_25620 [Clostridium sp. chh4-2]